MVLELLLLFASFYLLVKSSDYFVKYSSLIAKHFGISELVIGLTLVAIGTSIPELASSIVAAINGSGSIVIGNIVGSNIANIALIVGLSAFLYGVKKNRSLVLKDGYILLFITGLFLLTLYDLKITWIEGTILLVLYITYLMFLFEKKEENNENEFVKYINYVFLFRYVKRFKTIFEKGEDKTKKKEESIDLFKNFVVLALCIGGIVVGAKFLIDQAIYFAELFSLSEVFIGVTLIALGTSLPELSVTLSAIRNGFSDIAIGNIIGSNIANILLVGGAASLFGDISLFKSTYVIFMPYLFGITLLFLLLLKYRGISRFSGLIFLLVYTSFIWLLMFL